jgi:ABC-type multidrug transport system fused ATPase/permease subunit
MAGTLERLPPSSEIGWSHGLQFARRHWRLVAWFFATSAGRTAGTVSSIFLIQTFLTGVLSGPTGAALRLTTALGPQWALWTVAGLLCAIFVASGLASYASQMAMQRLVRRYELELVEQIVSHMLRLHLGFFDTRRRGDLVESVRQDVSRTRSIVSGCTDLVVFGAQTVAYVGAALWLSPRLSLIAMATMLLAAAPSRWVTRRMRRASRSIRKRGYRLTDVLFQLLQGIRTIKIYQGEALETANTVAASRQYQREMLRGARIKAVGDVLVETAANLGVVVVIVVGGLEVMSGRLTTPALVATLVALRAVHGPLNQGSARLMDIQANWGSLERVRELLATRPAIVDAPQALALSSPFSQLAFEGVSFGYRASNPVLQDVSFEVRRGQRIGIVGPSGAGKTTLLSLAARLYDPLSGLIRLNGRDLRHYRLADWHARVALVSQDSFVFSTTVRDNIRYGRLSATDADVERAAAAAHIHDDIQRLPDGYDTMLGVGGHTLSAGQVQRVSIARAFLKNAELLLLDEATSNLDAISDAHVREAIRQLEGGRTTLTVAHRLASVSDADLILVVDGGSVAATGTHSALLGSNALYRALWRAQLADAPMAQARA